MHVFFHVVMKLEFLKIQRLVFHLFPFNTFPLLFNLLLFLHIGNRRRAEAQSTTSRIQEFRSAAIVAMGLMGDDV